ncbi:MBL fold metallo-hydrolase, partial [Candidatus Saccharibacteria bacterium]|nr:MBL fold metallo-hydrolase [Candidatus Saccharibacteria bacterium]
PKEEEKTESSDSSSNVIDPKDLEIHFYATGKDDDAILIRTKDKTIVIDGGRCDNKEHSDSDSSCSRGMGFVNYLKEAGVTKIDVLIGSHVEWDHIQAQSVIVKNIPVTTAYYSVNIMNCTRNNYCSSEDYKYVKDALVSKGVNTTTISPPYTLTLGDMKFYFIGPNSLTSDNNKNSFVFILEYGKNKFMFTGDQSWWNLTNTSERGAALTKLENNARSLDTDIKVNLFKWPHHGYNQNGSGAHWNTSYGDAFFNAIKATYTIIPNGQSGCSGIPGSEARAFISKFNLKSYSTCGGNNIVVTSDGESIKIHEKQSPSSWKPTNQSTNTSSSSGGTRIGSSIADATFIDGNGCDDSTIFPGTKYNLDESQIKLVADRVGRENCGSPIACKAEASQIVNLYEYQHATNHSQARGSFWDWFKRTSWYSTSYSGLNLSRVTQKGIDAVKDVIVNGNRTLPARVVGHDTLEFQYPGYQYNITGFYTEGGQWRSLTASTSSQLIPGKTELTRRGASNKTFWCIIKYGNNKYGDPFTY